MPRTPKVRLPWKPSKLIRIALADLEKVEKSDKHCVNMEVWCRTGDDGVCEVCLAGAVMTQTLRIRKKSWPFQCGWRSGILLTAINSLRIGKIRSALEDIGRTRNKRIVHDMRDRRVRDYVMNTKGFKSDMNKLAADFEKRGL